MTDLLSDRLKDIKPHSPYMPDDIYIEASMEMVRNGEFQSQDGQPIEQKLKDALVQPLSYLTPERRKAFEEADIYILPLTACLAFCEAQREQKEIFISGGMIDLIANHILSLALEHCLPEELDNYHVPGIEDVGARHLLTDMLFVLNYRFFRYGEALPYIRNMFPDSSLSWYRERINEGIMFLLLHELGHLECGHLEGKYTGPRHHAAIIDEALSFEQKQEYDADKFARESLLPEYKGLCESWQLAAMNFFEQLEEITGIRANDHPLAINRSFLGHQLLQTEQLQNMTGFSRHEADFQKFAGNFQSAHKRFNAVKGHFLETTRAEALEIIWYIDLTFLQKHFGKSVQCILNRPARNWFDIPLVGNNLGTDKEAHL